MVVLSRFSPEENSLHRSSGGKSSEAVHKSLRLLRTVSEPEFDVDGTEELLRTDLTLSYKLLRYLNSPVFERIRPLNSIRHAIITLGQQPLRQWVSLVAVEELKLPSVVSHSDGILLSAALARFTFSRMSSAFFVQTKVFGFALW